MSRFGAGDFALDAFFTAFWVTSAPKARYLQAFGQLMLRSMHYLRQFGSLLLQRLAIYKLLASLGGEISVFYAPDGLSY